jgi:hypothetical protein
VNVFKNALVPVLVATVSGLVGGVPHVESDCPLPGLEASPPAEGS